MGQQWQIFKLNGHICIMHYYGFVSFGTRCVSFTLEVELSAVAEGIMGRLI